MWILYQLLAALALLLAGPVLLVRRGRHYLETLSGRFGAYRGPVPDRPVWLHAVSVGEAGVAATVVGTLPPDEPLLITTITPTGQARARETLAARVASGSAAVTYLPFELGWVIRRFLSRFSPRALVLVEGDLWPLLLHHVRSRSLPVFVINGRVGDRSYARMLRLRPLLGPLLGRVGSWGVQTEEDRDRLLRLGVDAGRVVVTGNLKFESPPLAAPPGLQNALQRLAADRPILVAGSTMAGEESKVLQAFDSIGGGDRALLVLAPRHPERWGEVERLLSERNLVTVARSRMEEAEWPTRPEVLLLDTLGELASVYAAGVGAFIGGTLVPTGGHNPLEPARFGVPVVVGPSMENFREMADTFDRERAWARVADSGELAKVWDDWLNEPANARDLGARAEAMIAANRGALEKTLALLQPILRPVAESDTE